MQVPESLERLLHEGIVEQVIRPLMSGKEAHVYLVVSGGEERVAKIYKDAQQRSFQNRADYTEGRKTRNSRDQRAIDKRSAHGRSKVEEGWRSNEVDMIYRLRAAGVRVPAPHHFVDGVLIMELVRDQRGEPAPRLAEVEFAAAEARVVFEHLIKEVQRTLCAGVVHGDLSDFNVLLAWDGPVIIDFPQAVDAARNQSARRLLFRDVDNLHRFAARFIPGHVPAPYAAELWHAYERGELTPTMPLTGRFRAASAPVRIDQLVSVVRGAEHDERRRREKHGQNQRGTSAPQPVYQGRPLSQHPTLGGKTRHKQHQPKQHQPKQHQPKQHQPKQHQPKQHQPKQHQPKQHQPKQHQPKQHQPKQHQPKQHQPKQHQPKQHQPTRHPPKPPIPDED